MSNQAIKIENIQKEYRLGAIGGGTLKGDLQSLWAKIRNKEDPNSKIGDTSGLSKGDRFMALDGISFEVKKGEALGIIGHNGAGKSTLLKLLCRVTAPTAGKISYDGRIASMLEVGTGFHPELTGRENVYMNGAILGMTKAEIDKKFDRIVEFAEMEKFIDTPVKRYSSGMYVKLAFSVAAHLDSEIMIMDEVLAVGDMAFQKKCLDKMRDAAKIDGRTVLYVSHNMNTIRQLCDRCIVLSKGKVIFDGNVEDAIEVYMGQGVETPPCVDLASFKRTQASLVDGVKLKSIKVLDSDIWKIKVGDKLRFSIDIEATEDLTNIGYRSRLSAVDGSSISVLLAPNLFSCKAGEKITIPLEADVTQLVPGRYCLTPVLYGVNPYGGWQFYDHVEKAVTFEVETKPGFNENMEWEQKWWGSVKLPEITDLRISGE
ncbi:MAG: ABC transporter ATP-binding protein [Clostridia bacterium]|nr:ABC transporter ATP-binding protein [Clostridia bacterium]